MLRDLNDKVTGKRHLGRRGRYRLLERISRDDLGTVWNGEDRLLGHSVTIRVVHSDWDRDEAFAERLRTTLRTVCPRLAHPTVVRVLSYNYGEDGPRQFIVMERVDGLSLSQRLVQGPPLAPEEAARIALRLADALSAAHGLGVVHGGVSPWSVLFNGGLAKLTDFGLLPAILAGNRRQLVRSDIAYHLAPEQITRSRTIPASDSFGLGVTLLRMVQGVTSSSLWNVRIDDWATVESWRVAELLSSGRIPPFLANVCQQALTLDHTLRPLPSTLAAMLREGMAGGPLEILGDGADGLSVVVDEEDGRPMREAAEPSSRRRTPR